MYKILTVISVFILTFASKLYSQRVFNHLTREDGLSSNNVSCFVQDKIGFLWIGTNNGINRFDGTNFKSYKFDVRSTASLSSSNILSLCFDKRNRLWVGTAYGMNLYDSQNDKFLRIAASPKVTSQYLNVLYEDNSGRILAGTSHGIAYYNETNKKVDLIKSSLFGGKSILSIFQDKNYNIWIGTEEYGLYKCAPDFSVVERMDHLGMKAKESVRSINQRPDGNLIVGTDNGLYIINNGILQRHFIHNNQDITSLSSNKIKAIHVTKEKNIWIGTENGGINILNAEGDGFTHLENNPAQKESLSQNTISTIFEDNQGSIWIGTVKGGINQYNHFINRFEYYTYGVGSQFTSYKDIRAFYETEAGRLYVASDGGGLNILDRENKTFEYFKENSSNNSISSNAVLDILGLDEQLIMIATWAGGVNIFDLANKSFTKYKSDGRAGSVSSNYVNVLYKDKKDNIWVGTSYGGLNLFDPDTKTFMSDSLFGIKASDIPCKNITSIQEDQRGNLWLGSEDAGVVRLNFELRKVDNFFTYTDSKTGKATSETGKLVYIDTKNRVWATHYNLELFDTIKNEFSKNEIPETLRKETIQSIVQDDKGIFWMGTLNGLISYDHDKGAVNRYDKADGMQDLDYELNSCLKLSSGELVFGGYNGFTIFNPLKIIPNYYKAPIVITGFTVDGKDYTAFKQGNNITNAKKIKLGYKQNNLNIEFATLNYILPKKTQYLYKLEGFDKDWVNNNNINTASFTNLNPGNYIFKVKAANNDGIWNEQMTSFHIVITPPYWQTIWFKLIILLFIALLIYLYLKLHNQLISEKIEEKKIKEMYDLKLDFFTHISHEFKTPLSLISGAAEKMISTDDHLKSNKNHIQLSKNISRLSYLIKELMDFRKTETGVVKLSVQFQDLNKTLTSIAEEFNSIAENKNITFDILISKEPQMRWFDKNIIEKIVLNLLNNAFKYSLPGCKIVIDTAKPPIVPIPRYKNSIQIGNNKGVDYTYFSIIDSGVGISQADLPLIFNSFYRSYSNVGGSGIGLTLVKNLILLHKGLLIFGSEANKGTEIIVGLPASNACYSHEEIYDDKSHVFPQMDNIQPDIRLWESGLQHNDEAAPLIHTLNTPVLLIVEDNNEIRSFLQETLAQEYKVETAINGEEGFLKAKITNPSIIITDIVMPEMNGLVMCEKIKENEELKNIPIIVLTGQEIDETKIKSFEMGIEHFFSKPVNVHLLKLTINNILSRNKNLKQYFLQDYNNEIKEKLHNTKDKELINALLMLIEENMENPDLDIGFICKKIGQSQSKLYKEIKKITGMSITEFIRHTRLKKAEYLIIHTDMNITEIMTNVGIHSASYFTKSFTKIFGKTPSAFIKDVRRR